jgi:hypothetical protein
MLQITGIINFIEKLLSQAKNPSVDDAMIANEWYAVIHSS